MLFINGEIRKEGCLGKMFTLVKFEADELCKNYTPYVIYSFSVF